MSSKYISIISFVHFARECERVIEIEKTWQTDPVCFRLKVFIWFWRGVFFFFIFFGRGENKKMNKTTISSNKRKRKKRTERGNRTRVAGSACQRLNHYTMPAWMAARNYYEKILRQHNIKLFIASNFKFIMSVYGFLCTSRSMDLFSCPQEEEEKEKKK